MKTLKFICLSFIGFVFILGCSGNNANIRNLSQSESKTIQQELLDNWSDYDISYHTAVLVFDPKNDDKKILVGNYWGTVNDQETWTRLINGSERLPGSWQTNIVWGNQIREIWVNNQFYGYISNQPLEQISAKIVDENTVRLFRTRNVAPIT